MVVIDVMMIVMFLWYAIPAFLYIAIGISVAGTAIPIFRKGLEYGFHALSRFLGKVMSTLIMLIFFTGILTPMALLRKLSRSNRAFSQRGKTASSFTEINGGYEKEDFEKLW